MLGKKHSEETKRRMSLAQMGNQNGKGNKGNTGRKRSEESMRKWKETYKRNQAKKKGIVN